MIRSPVSKACAAGANDVTAWWLVPPALQNCAWITFYNSPLATCQSLLASGCACTAIAVVVWAKLAEEKSLINKT
ncbi:MAG: hypothetical protein C5B53_01205 [Candidatus Melainabacteria bacterium]|nr:MAG: hypothetical protein C5B53_01205 [Candidatus Melainabacteria bacterium]